MIRYIQMDNSTVASKDDRALYNQIYGQSGIFYGCECTHLGSNQVKISAGRGIISGGTFEIEEETVNVDLSSQGNAKGRLYIHVDLNNAATPVEITSVAAATLPVLVQEDLTRDGQEYEMALIEYDVTEATISNISDKRNMLAPVLTEERKTVTFYLSPTGSDEDGDGTEESPFLTIGHAVSQAPLNAGNVAIEMAAGTYTENVNLSFVPFALSISSADLSSTVSIASMSVAYCQHLDVRGLTFTGSTTATNKPQLNLSYVGSAYVASCKFNGGTDVTGVAANYGSNVFLYTCTLNNCGFSPIYSGHGSTITAERPSGSGNGVLFYAEAGLIYYYYATSFLGSSLKTEALGGEVRTAG